MNTLRDLQENLQAYLLANDQKIKTQITKPVHDAIDIRLEIYREHYYVALTNILKKAYDVLLTLIGEETFDELSVAYISAMPSRYFNVNEFGQHFPDFLRKHKLYSQHEYVAELAQLNWELDHTLIMPDANILTPNDLATIPPDAWGELRVQTLPYVKIISQHWNTVELWQALKQKQPLPKIMELKEPRDCLIWRKGYMPYYHVLTQQEAWAIKAFQQGKTFAEICEGLMRWMSEEQVAQYTVNLLITWLNAGIFSQSVSDF